MILEQPLLGWGSNTTLFFAHNSVLDLAITYGILVAVGWCIILVVVMSQSHRSLSWEVDPATHQALGGIWVALLLSLAFNMVTSVFIGDPFFNLLFWFCAGIVCRDGFQRFEQ